MRIHKNSDKALWDLWMQWCYTHLNKILHWVLMRLKYTWGFPGGASVKELFCQCRRWKRCRFDPWVGKIPGSGRSPGGVPAAHSCTLPRGISWTEEPGGLESIGLQRVRYNWSNLACKVHLIRDFICGSSLELTVLSWKWHEQNSS